MTRRRRARRRLPSSLSRLEDWRRRPSSLCWKHHRPPPLFPLLLEALRRRPPSSLPLLEPRRHCLCRPRAAAAHPLLPPQASHHLPAINGQRQAAPTLLVSRPPLHPVALLHPQINQQVLLLLSQNRCRCRSVDFASNQNRPPLLITSAEAIVQPPLQDQRQSVPDLHQEQKQLNKISEAIRDGAEGFFQTQYGTISKMAIVLALVILSIYIFRSSTPQQESSGLGRLASAYITVAAFLLGAVCSGVAGYVGMWVSVCANVRVASAARRSAREALQVAVRAGGLSAIIVAGMAVIGVTILYATFYVWLGVGSHGSMKVTDCIFLLFFSKDQEMT